MRMNKRILVFGMSTAFVASMLGGCGTGTSSSGSVKNSVTSNAVAFNNNHPDRNGNESRQLYHNSFPRRLYRPPKVRPKNLTIGGRYTVQG